MKREFNKTRSLSDIIISIATILGGTICLAIPSSDSINVAGFFLIITGLVLVFLLKTSFKDSETGIIFKKKERFFSMDMKEEILSAMTRQTAIDSRKENIGNSLKLDVYWSRKNNKAYAQLFEYIPYTYEPCTELYEYTVDKATELIG